MSIKELVIQEAREKLKILLTENREKIIQKKNSESVTRNLLKGALLGAGASGLITGANILADNPDVTHHPDTAIAGLLLGAGGGALLGMGLSKFKSTKPGNTKEEIKNRLIRYTLLGAGASALAMGGYAAAGNHIGHHRLIGAGLLLGAGAGHLLGRITSPKNEKKDKK